MNIFSSKVLVFLFVIFFSLAGCSRMRDALQGTNSSVIGPYPQAVRDEFMKGCTGAGSEAGYCSCVLDKVEKKYTLNEFREIESKLKAGTPPDDFVQFGAKAKAECTTK